MGYVIAVKSLRNILDLAWDWDLIFKKSVTAGWFDLFEVFSNAGSIIISLLLLISSFGPIHVSWSHVWVGHDVCR